MLARTWPLHSFELAYKPVGSNPSELPVAVECLLYARVRRMKVKKKYNKFNETRLVTFHGDSKVAPSSSALVTLSCGKR